MGAPITPLAGGGVPICGWVWLPSRSRQPLLAKRPGERACAARPLSGSCFGCPHHAGDREGSPFLLRRSAEDCIIDGKPAVRRATIGCGSGECDKTVRSACCQDQLPRAPVRRLGARCRPTAPDIPISTKSDLPHHGITKHYVAARNVFCPLRGF